MTKTSIKNKKKLENNKEEEKKQNKKIDKVIKSIGKVNKNIGINIINSIDDPDTKKIVQEMLIDDINNNDNQTWQYLWRFEESFLTLVSNKEDPDEEKNIGDKLNKVIDKIDTLYWQSWMWNFTNRIKDKIIWLFYYIKGDIRENYTRNLDFKILALIEKNLPKYNSGVPWTLDTKQWELIKAKLSHLSRYLAEHEGDCVQNLMEKYSMEWETEGVKLRYRLISEKELSKKIKECYKEEEKMKEELKKLLWEYLFQLWD